MKRWELPALIVAVSALLTGCGEDPMAEDASGKALYNHYCARCHHKDGVGDFLRGVPANRTTLLSERQLVSLIRYGHAGEKMPSFAELSEEQAERIADYLLNELGR